MAAAASHVLPSFVQPPVREAEGTFTSDGLQTDLTGNPAARQEVGQQLKHKTVSMAAGQECDGNRTGSEEEEEDHLK